MKIINQILFASRGRNPEHPSDRRAGIHLEQRAEINDTGFSNTLTSVEKDNYILVVYENMKLRVRKLTPTECFILMGLTKEDCHKAMDVGVSDSQLYKQAGNGIVTNCVELLFEHLYKAQYDENYECSDENFMQPQ